MRYLIMILMLMAHEATATPEAKLTRTPHPNSRGGRDKVKKERILWPII